jgi:hypothetical protein
MRPRAEWPHAGESFAGRHNGKFRAAGSISLASRALQHWAPAAFADTLHVLHFFDECTWRYVMDELIKVLMEKAGLTEAQAKAAAEAVIEYMKHEDNRKKMVVLAGAASAVASAVAVRAI